jgi:acetylglutamate kinase
MAGKDTAATVLKLGGELLEDRAAMRAIARVIGRVVRADQRPRPLVVVHGGGKEIDAALAAAGIPKRQVDGLRITDEATLQVVVGVLAGTINTRFVAAINAAGGRAVGLTGADAGVGQVRRAKPHRATTRERVDLGLVGEPLANGEASLVTLLMRHRFVPVLACVGADARGQLYNVNADTLAVAIAARIRAARLVIAGGTAGVRDAAGATIDTLTAGRIRELVQSGTATAGMIAKLRACNDAVIAGVKDVVVADGRSSQLMKLMMGTAPMVGPWTRVQ